MIRFRTLLPLLFVLCAATLSGCASSRSALPDRMGRPRPAARHAARRRLRQAGCGDRLLHERDARPGGGQFRQELGSEPGRPQPVRPAQCQRHNGDEGRACGHVPRDLPRRTRTGAAIKLVDEVGPDTLRVTAAIVDLFVTAPNTMTAGRSRTYTANTGRMTLVAELRDSVTGEILARVVDAQSGRSAGTWMATSSVTNNADARRAIGIWATALRRSLDGLYGRPN